VARLLATHREDPEAWLFALAQRVHGGFSEHLNRVHLVEWLAANAKSLEPRRWLVREGFRNELMDGYLARVCAEGGRLREQLEVAEPDDALLLGASELWRMLLNNLAGSEMDVYEDGAAVAGLLLGHLERRANRLEHFEAVADQRDWLAAEKDWDWRASRGWTPEVCAQLRARCDALLARPLCRELVEQGLASDNPLTFSRAAGMGEKTGLDVWEAAFRRYAAGELGEAQRLARSGDPGRARRFVAATQRMLDLARLCTGPTPSVIECLGRDVQKHHQAHELALCLLSRLPGEGWVLVEAGLRSQAVEVRHSALRVLRAWREWPVEAADALRAAHAREPQKALKAEAQGLLEHAARVR
jgi:hypothetical protein